MYLLRSRPLSLPADLLVSARGKRTGEKKKERIFLRVSLAVTGPSSMCTITLNKKSRKLASSDLFRRRLRATSLNYVSFGIVSITMGEPRVVPHDAPRCAKETNLNRVEFQF